MPWFYVDDGFADSKPVVNLPDHLVKVPLRLAACGLWVLAGSWSAKEEFDGFVPPSKLRQLGATPTVIRALTEPGPLNAPLCSTEPDPWWAQEWAQDQAQIGAQIGSRSGPNRGPIWVRNWPKWQKTRSENIAKRKADAEKKRSQRNGQKIKGRNAVVSADIEMSPGDTPGDSNESPEASEIPSVNKLSEHVPEGQASDASRARPRGPDPTRPLVETSASVVPVGSHPAAAHTDDAPPRFCDLHPNGTRDRCGDCGNARTAFEAWELTRTRQLVEADNAAEGARRKRRELIDACRRCDDFGRLDDLTPCDHQEVTA